MKAQLKEVLKEVRRIEISTHGLVEGLLAGAYHSVFKGRGIEFSEVREYMPGDDIRTIDWNVTARMNAPFVKEFIEERDLPVYILFDISASQNFGYEKSKKRAAIEIAASLMFAAVKDNDPVALCMFSDRVEKFIPPRKGRKHVLRILLEMILHEPKGKGTNLEKPIRYIANIAKRRGIIFIISDFLAGEFEKPLRILRKKHDVVLVNISDMREEDIPDIGYVVLEDEETGEQVLVNTSDPEFRKAYTRLSKKHAKKLGESFRKSRVDMISLVSGESYEISLRKFFRMRERRMVR
ncbi:MAG: DUF58 domain-containing protein [Candidatus Micrarchaeota archaeon]|nr:DUF58 domain-containing protein [Candidatus Micrarchaeota archaeon]